MAVYKRFSPNIQSAFGVVIMIAVWLAFAPTQVGGMVSYIIVIGQSMEPKFHIGDLVVAHKEPIYRVGDAIVYRSLELKSFVFHRIISQEMGHYTLKGDNNSWVDNYQPSHEEVIGKLWLHIPRGGAALQKTRSPLVMALIAGALGALLAASLSRDKSKGKKRMNDRSFREWFNSVQQKSRSWLTKINTPEPKKPGDFDQGKILEGLFFVLGFIALSTLILGIIAFSRPTSRIAQDDLTYEHLGIFSYSASAPQDVYDADTIKSGDPIFTNLTCSVDINFQYTLVAAQTENIAGTYQWTAIISEPLSGWQRTIPLQEQTSFSGSAFGSTANLDLCKIASLTQSMEEKTNARSGSYTLSMAPNIRLTGEVSGRALEGVFNPALVFRYDRVQFYLVRNEEQGNPLTLTETGILREEHKEANTMPLFGKEMAVPTLRLIALFGFIGSLIALVVLGLRLQNLSRLDQDKFFHIKYDSMMIDVETCFADPIGSSSAIQVTSMDALAKLAERFNAMILHTEQDNLHMYYVQAGGATYQFMTAANKTGSTLPESEATGQEGGA